MSLITCAKELLRATSPHRAVAVIWQMYPYSSTA